MLQVSLSLTLAYLKILDFFFFQGKANPDRFRNLYSGAKRMTRDGYNSLKYKRINMVLKKLYTWILVDLAHLKH
jgi:hypothetical protein